MSGDVSNSTAHHLQDVILVFPTVYHVFGVVATFLIVLLCLIFCCMYKLTGSLISFEESKEMCTQTDLGDNSDSCNRAGPNADLEANTANTSKNQRDQTLNRKKQLPNIRSKLRNPALALDTGTPPGYAVTRNSAGNNVSQSNNIQSRTVGYSVDTNHNASDLLRKEALLNNDGLSHANGHSTDAPQTAKDRALHNGYSTNVSRTASATARNNPKRNDIILSRTNSDSTGIPNTASDMVFNDISRSNDVHPFNNGYSTDNLRSASDITGIEALSNDDIPLRSYVYSPDTRPHDFHTHADGSSTDVPHTAGEMVRINASRVVRAQANGLDTRRTASDVEWNNASHNGTPSRDNDYATDISRNSTDIGGRSVSPGNDIINQTVKDFIRLLNKKGDFSKALRSTDRTDKASHDSSRNNDIPNRANGDSADSAIRKLYTERNKLHTKDDSVAEFATHPLSMKKNQLRIKTKVKGENSQAGKYKMYPKDRPIDSVPDNLRKENSRSHSKGVSTKFATESLYVKENKSRDEEYVLYPLDERFLDLTTRNLQTLRKKLGVKNHFKDSEDKHPRVEICSSTKSSDSDEEYTQFPFADDRFLNLATGNSNKSGSTTRSHNSYNGKTCKKVSNLYDMPLRNGRRYPY